MTEERPHITDEQPRTLRAMLTQSKDTAGLMVDLAIGAVSFHDSEMSKEVEHLWEDLTESAHQMRVVGIQAARSRAEAQDMARVIQVIGAMEDLGRDAVDIARISSRGSGLPAGLVSAMSGTGSLLARVLISEGSLLDGQALSSFRLPLEVGIRVIARRRGGNWDTDIKGDTVLQSKDVAVLIGPRDGLAHVRRLAGEPPTVTPDPSEASGPAEFGVAAHLLGEMQTLAELAVGLAYAALFTADSVLASEVTALAQRLEELKNELHGWVLRTANTSVAGSGLSALLLLSQATEHLGDRAADMVRHVTNQERTHPVLPLAFGESDEIAIQVTITSGSRADGGSVRDLVTGTGFSALATRRNGQFQRRPQRGDVLRAGDEIIATGPPEGHALFSARAQ